MKHIQVIRVKPSEQVVVMNPRGTSVEAERLAGNVTVLRYDGDLQLLILPNVPPPEGKTP